MHRTMTINKQSLILNKSESYFEFCFFRILSRNAKQRVCVEASFWNMNNVSWIFSELIVFLPFFLCIAIFYNNLNKSWEELDRAAAIRKNVFCWKFWICIGKVTPTRFRYMEVSYKTFHTWYYLHRWKSRWVILFSSIFI